MHNVGQGVARKGAWYVRWNWNWNYGGEGAATWVPWHRCWRWETLRQQAVARYAKN